MAAPEAPTQRRPTAVGEPAPARTAIRVGSADDRAAPASPCPGEEPGDPFGQLTPLLGQLAARYPGITDQVLRQQAVDVLHLAKVHRLSVATLARLVEARVLALL
jgi:hypothetical protein